MSVWRTRIIAATGLALFAAGVWYLLTPSPIPVDMATVSRAPLEVTVDEEGVTKIREIYRVSAPIAGLMLRSPRDVGDEVVKEKTLIATIKPTDPSFLDKRTRAAGQAAANAAQAAVKLAEAQVSKAKAEVNYAKADLERARLLSKHQTISKTTLEQAELRMITREALLETANAELEVRSQELERARAQLIEPRASSQSPGEPCCIEVKAPVSGRVLKVLTESETVVASGANILEVGNPADLEITVDLLSDDAVRVREGAEVTIENWGGTDNLKGSVTRIEPAGFMKVSALGIEEQRVKARINISTSHDKWQRLGHDYRVFVRISIWKKPDALNVPLSALFRQQDSWAVFRVLDGAVKLQTVKIGQRNNRNAEVLEGLSEGDRVVLHPNERLVDGSRIIERTILN